MSSFTIFLYVVLNVVCFILFSLFRLIEDLLQATPLRANRS
jgi:hypothetical protein